MDGEHLLGVEKSGEPILMDDSYIQTRLREAQNHFFAEHYHETLRTLMYIGVYPETFTLDDSRLLTKRQKKQYGWIYERMFFASCFLQSYQEKSRILRDIQKAKAELDSGKKEKAIEIENGIYPRILTLERLLTAIGYNDGHEVRDYFRMYNAMREKTLEKNTISERV